MMTTTTTVVCCVCCSRWNGSDLLRGSREWCRSRPDYSLIPSSRSRRRPHHQVRSYGPPHCRQPRTRRVCRHPSSRRARRHAASRPGHRAHGRSARRHLYRVPAEASLAAGHRVRRGCFGPPCRHTSLGRQEERRRRPSRRGGVLRRRRSEDLRSGGVFQTPAAADR